MAKQDRALTAFRKLEKGLIKNIDAIKRGCLPGLLEQAEKDLADVRRDIQAHIARQGQPLISTTVKTEHDEDGDVIKVTVVEKTKIGKKITIKKTVTKPTKKDVSGDA